jgi:SAM-dependent methyltransferase
MDARQLFYLFSKILGPTPLHPQFFSRRFLRRQVKKNSGRISGVIADLGCGFKPYQRYFKKARHVGLDYPSTALAVQSGRADLFGDLTDLPFKTACLDGVLCTQVLEHIAEPSRALSEIHRVLKPGGILLLSAPFFYPLHDEPHDYYRFSHHGLNHLLTSADLEMTEITHQGGYIAMAGEFLNLFLLHKMSNLTSKGGARLVLGLILTPFILVFALIINLSSLLLSQLDRERRFVMNYFVLAKKD